MGSEPELSSPSPLSSLASYDFDSLTLLALIQGLTEFLPISSSGHLVLAQAAMGFEEPALALDVALHVGTLIAVVVVYRRDLLELARGALRGDFREPLLLMLATLPAAVIGLTFKDSIQAAFHRPDLAARGLFVTAAVLMVGEVARRRRIRSTASAQAEVDASRAQESSERPLSAWHALLIGTAQAVAIFPGISRSGSTIAVGMMCGLSAERAARFSFLLSIPAILGAAVLNLPDAMAEAAGVELRAILWATLLAGFVGWGALRILIVFLGRGAFTWFAVYCAVLGAGALWAVN